MQPIDQDPDGTRLRLQFSYILCALFYLHSRCMNRPPPDLTANSRALKWFLETALSYLGTPYIWGGDDPSGFDCSGFVVECLKAAGFLAEGADSTADGLLHRFADHTVARPSPGALLFTVNESGAAFHVAICLDEHFQISVAGGDRTVTDSTAAWRANAYIRIRPIRFDPRSMKVINLFDFGKP